MKKKKKKTFVKENRCFFLGGGAIVVRISREVALLVLSKNQFFSGVRTW